MRRRIADRGSAVHASYRAGEIADHFLPFLGFLLPHDISHMQRFKMSRFRFVRSILGSKAVMAIFQKHQAETR